jgi:hypothetical protein
MIRQIRKQPVLLIVLLSLVLRVGTAFFMGNEVVDLPGIFDQISYHNLAVRVMDGYGFTFGELWWPITPAGEPTAHWSFSYTLYLVGNYLLFGVYPLAARIVQAVIVGILHPYITWRICEKIFGRNIGLIAAGITAVYAYYIYYAAALMTESFYITGILISLFLSMKMVESQNVTQDIKLGVALGISIGITVTLRQVFLLFIPFLFLWILIARFKRTRSMPIASMILSFVLITLFILPVSLYNQSRFGRLVILNTNSGYAFFWGNHPIYGTNFIPILPAGTYQDLIPQEVRHLDEAALDQELLKRGIQFIVDDPQRYILLSLSRIPPYFMFWYSPESNLWSNVSRIASFGLMFPAMIYGVFLRIKKTSSETGKWLWSFLISPEGLLFFFAVIYSLVHILTWTLIRYRLPVDAVLIPFAALAISDLSQRLSAKS